jgi:hypothetical protein
MDNEALERESAADLAYEIIERVAPEELSLYPLHRDAYLNDPKSLAKQEREGEDVLGFGLGGAESLLTPIVFAVAKEVVSFLYVELRKSLKTGTADYIHTRIKQMFRDLKAKHPPGANLLSAAQLERVHEIARKKARLIKLSEAKAELLADAIIANLSQAAPAQGNSRA